MKGGRLELRRLSSQVTVTHDAAPLSWKRLDTCLPMGSRERMPDLALHACAAFALPIKLCVSQPSTVLTFTLPILFPIPLGGASGSVGLSCLPGLT